MSYRKLIAEQKDSVLYRPSWNEFTGSMAATIFLNQMIYWWEKSGGKPFYKFSSPCAHDAYREGDSWQEELGMSRAEFEGARAKVSEKRKKGERAGGELVSYWVDMNRLTWYTLNEVAVDNALHQHYVMLQSRITQCEKQAVDNTETTTQTTTERVAHAPASIDDLLPQDDLYRDGMTKAEYIAAKEAEIDQLAPYEKAIRAVISQSRITADNYNLLVDTAKAYRDAGLTPDDIRKLWATNSGSFWKANTVGGSKPNSGKPWLGNVSSELSRAVEWLNEGGLQGDAAKALEYLTSYQETKQATGWVNGAGELAKRAGQHLGGISGVTGATKQQLVEAIKAVATA